MKDSEIIELYFARKEQAILETQNRYEAYCMSISLHILHSKEEAEECVNDTWFKAWNAIPPNRPAVLSAFLGTITRNLSFDRWKKKNARKRGNGEMEIVLDELAECIPDRNHTEDLVETRLLQESINAFLGILSEKDRCVFVRRYFFAEEYEEISKKYNLKLNTVKTSLFRTRQKLKKHLEEQGIVV